MIFGAAGAVAQTQASLTAEKNRLARMEQSLENRTVEAEDIENELLSYEYKLKRAQESLQKARENYEQSRRELQQAEHDHELKANSDTERQLHKTKHAFSMAERGVDSRSRRVEFIQTNYNDLKAQLDEARTALSQGEHRIAAQKQKVDQMINSMLANAEATQRAAAEAKVAKKAAPVSKPQLSPPSVVAAKAQSQPQAVPAAKREVDPELMDYVKRERKRLKKLLSEGEGIQSFESLDMELSDGDKLAFEFLGQNQYRLVAPVEAGRQIYKIENWKFRRTIPSDDNGVRYVFIFDARRLSRPRLVMYPEYVLSELD